jgi:hypothetical protein
MPRLPDAPFSRGSCHSGRHHWNVGRWLSPSESADEDHAACGDGVRPGEEAMDCRVVDAVTPESRRELPCLTTNRLTGRD